MPTSGYQRTKFGDAKTLTWDLERDLTGVSEARVLVSVCPGGPVVLDRVGTITDVTNGIVQVTLDPLVDYGPGKIQGGKWYVHEVQTQPGPLTHPTTGHGRLYCERQLA